MPPMATLLDSGKTIVILEQGTKDLGGGVTLEVPRGLTATIDEDKIAASVAEALKARYSQNVIDAGHVRTGTLRDGATVRKTGKGQAVVEPPASRSDFAGTHLYIFDIEGAEEEIDAGIDEGLGDVFR